MDGIDRRALILGAAGSFGGAVAQELGRRGWRLRLLVRDPAHLARLALAEDAEIVVGDARDPALVAHAAEGTDAIVHAVNLPWQHWEPAMRRITAAAVTAAREAHIRLVFPGNVYGFGRQDGRPLHEAAERRATTAKGRLRIALEQTIEDLGDSGAAPVLILRAGDFYGPTVRNRLVEMIFGRLARGQAPQWPGALDLPHQWCFMPDLARIVADLLDRDDQLAAVEHVHVPGHVFDSQRRFMEMAARAAGRPGLLPRALPGWVLRLGALGDAELRALQELRYLFDDPVIITGSRLGTLLPDFRPTTPERAIAATVAARNHAAAGAAT
ncbi:membrane protein [Tistrella bauzanensis]|uniref:Membrane protein n=1 Tax=Tistrella bauzanensis TaxID=657419 RepID=A0ABQ1IJY7_9PROT|nr:NAD(P)H-binding protein [Tistrella bauzanensis]GGB39654.1 membrane protein [Tistrella bauzanensis]